MPRDDLLYLDDMLEMAEQVTRFMERKSRADLDNDKLLQFAVLHAHQIIGEAAWKVSERFQELHPQIPCKAISGFRHRAVHDYFNVRIDTVWQITTQEIRPLIDQIKPLIPPGEPPDAHF